MAITQLLRPNRNLELHEELRKLMSHVHAQVILISAEGLENFCSHSDQIKGNYLWSIADAAECPPSCGGCGSGPACEHRFSIFEESFSVSFPNSGSG